MTALDRKNVIAYQVGTVELTSALLKGASAVITNGTGIRHPVAGVPTVGIFMRAEKHYAEPFRTGSATPYMKSQCRKTDPHRILLSRSIP